MKYVKYFRIMDGETCTGFTRVITESLPSAADKWQLGELKGERVPLPGPPGGGIENFPRPRLDNR